MVEVKLDIDNVPASGRSSLEHDDLAVSLNYWFNSNLVLKFGYHKIEGNLFAHPADIFQAIIEDRLDDSTDLITFGAQFSF